MIWVASLIWIASLICVWVSARHHGRIDIMSDKWTGQWHSDDGIHKNWTFKKMKRYSEKDYK